MFVRTTSLFVFQHGGVCSVNTEHLSLITTHTDRHTNTEKAHTGRWTQLHTQMQKQNKYIKPCTHASSVWLHVDFAEGAGLSGSDKHDWCVRVVQ